MVSSKSFFLGFLIACIGWAGLWLLTDYALLSWKALWLIAWVNVVHIGQYMTDSA